MGASAFRRRSVSIKVWGGTRQYDEKVWEAFGDRVGWRKNNEWLDYSDFDDTFSEKAAEAHLPRLASGAGSVGGWARGASRLSRRDL
jgi:hypothetical protein